MYTLVIRLYYATDTLLFLILTTICIQKVLPVWEMTPFYLIIPFSSTYRAVKVHSNLKSNHNQIIFPEMCNGLR